MKLGEAGEAFFVEEIENDISDSLSTSPLPSAETLKDAKKDHGASCEVSFDVLKSYSFILRIPSTEQGVRCVISCNGQYRFSAVTREL